MARCRCGRCGSRATRPAVVLVRARVLSRDLEEMVPIRASVGSCRDTATQVGNLAEGDHEIRRLQFRSTNFVPLVERKFVDELVPFTLPNGVKSQEHFDVKHPVDRERARERFLHVIAPPKQLGSALRVADPQRHESIDHEGKRFRGHTASAVAFDTAPQ